MANWNILISDALAESGKTVLSEKAELVDKAGIGAEDLLTEIENADALIVRGRTKVTAKVLEAGKKLKVVGRAGVGVDNIDLEAAKENQIIVVNTPTATSNAVAELTLGLILSLSRHIPQADSSMKAGNWNKKKFKGSELSGKTLGVIGMGRIGSIVGSIASAFGVRVIGYDPFISAEVIKERGAEAVSLEELYSRADIITLHLPLTKETRGMVDGDAFTQMKPGVLLISAARGGIIDEEDLLKRLNSGQVGGAALDVFTNEPPKEWDLISHPNVVATPHIAAQTEEAQERASLDVSLEVLNALEGEELRWRIV